MGCRAREGAPAAFERFSTGLRCTRVERRAGDPLCYTRAMMSRLKLLEFLADGRFHSGQALARHIGVTRAAVWKQMQALQAAGVDIHGVRGRGYRLAHPLELLETDKIRAHLSFGAGGQIAQLELLTEVDSTNTYLKQQAREGAPSGAACLAETQRAGRGRLGRSWVSPFACNLYLSLLWRFDAGPSVLGGLSLVAGVALVQALGTLLPHGLALKWPNDLQCNGRKLAGVLVEVAGESAGPCHAVIGIGINVRMPDDFAAQITQPWTDLTRCLGKTPSRNVLAGAVLTQLVEALQLFERQGLLPFLDTWRAHDATAGKPVQLHLPVGVVIGNARGIDDDGALLLQVGDELRRFASGELSVRPLS